MTIITPTTTTEDTNDTYYTVHEVAHKLRVDDTTVRRWIKSGALPAIALPHTGVRRSYRIAKEEYDKLVATGDSTPMPVLV